MSEPSPGPYTIHTRKVDGGKCILDADSRVIALLENIHDDDERAANARLIAAAPGMLEALQAAETLGASGHLKLSRYSQDESDEFWALVQSAIAQATGSDA